MSSVQSIPIGIDDTLRSVMMLNFLGKVFKGLMEQDMHSVLP